jgi:hypothetical protein
MMQHIAKHNILSERRKTRLTRALAKKQMSVGEQTDPQSKKPIKALLKKSGLFDHGWREEFMLRTIKEENENDDDF